MLIIPELQAIFIFPPRTGSDTLCVELMRMHPNAFLLYRHAEADLVPESYESFRKVGFIRHPWARLWSLFKYCAMLGDIPHHPALGAEIERVVKSVQGVSFEQWVLKNEELFLPANSGIPILHQRVHVPETRKSQKHYLRPDLGTVILKFQDLQTHMQAWGLDHTKVNGATPKGPVPPMSKKAKKHMHKYFEWDMMFPDLEVL